MRLLYGAVFAVSGGVPRITTSLLANIAGGETFGVPNSVYFAVGALLVVVAFVVKKTVVGRRFEAIGANPLAARAVGLNVRRASDDGVCLFAQLLYCLAGFLLAGITREPTAFQGDSLLLPSVAVVVLGGTSVARRGRGFPALHCHSGLLPQSIESVRARDRRAVFGSNHHPSPGARVWDRRLLRSSGRETQERRS